MPKFQGLFVPGKAGNSLFRSRPFVFGVMALRVYFRGPRPPSSLAGLCSTQPDGKCYLYLYTRVVRTFRFGPIRFLHIAFCPLPPTPTLLSLPFSGVLTRFFKFFFISCSSHFLFVFSITFQINSTLASNAGPRISHQRV